MKQPEDAEEFCTVIYAAQRTGLAAKTWYQGGAGTNRVRRIRFGRSVRLLRSDLEQFIREHISDAERTVGRNAGN
jgi:predicted DNA-binding transcriptional regulator AlpA